MEKTGKKTLDIFRKDLKALLNENPSISMRQLSQEIYASKSYIQKILTENASPSLAKIDSLSEYFHLSGWELFYDFEDITQNSLAIIQLVNQLPAPLLPLVNQYMEFLLRQQDSIKELCKDSQTETHGKISG